MFVTNKKKNKSESFEYSFSIRKEGNQLRMNFEIVSYIVTIY